MKLTDFIQTTEQAEFVKTLRTMFIESKGREQEILTEALYVDLLCTIKERYGLTGEELKDATLKVFNALMFAKA